MAASVEVSRRLGGGGLPPSERNPIHLKPRRNLCGFNPDSSGALPFPSLQDLWVGSLHSCFNEMTGVIFSYVTSVENQHDFISP